MTNQPEEQEAEIDIDFEVDDEGVLEIKANFGTASLVLRGVIEDVDDSSLDVLSTSFPNIIGAVAERLYGS